MGIAEPEAVREDAAANDQTTVSEAGADDKERASVVELLLRPRRFESSACDRSVFTVDCFASPEECKALVDKAHQLLASYGKTYAQPARSRLSIVTPVDRVLRLRLLALLEAELPEFAHAAFGQATGLAELRPDYSPGEPAVNIYKKGGEFAPHTDKQSVSLLVPLSDEGVAFEGGGTAFWPDGHHPRREDTAADDTVDENDRSHWLPHSHMLRPPTGTAIIFGGGVTHAGLPVTSGTRHLFVMSFTLRPGRVVKPDGGAPVKALSDSGDEPDVADGLADFADLFGD